MMADFDVNFIDYDILTEAAQALLDLHRCECDGEDDSPAAERARLIADACLPGLTDPERAAIHRLSELLARRAED
jgi:hypothetical protein